jgi:hypothetical protein
MRRSVGSGGGNYGVTTTFLLCGLPKSSLDWIGLDFLVSSTVQRENSDRLACM